MEGYNIRRTLKIKDTNIGVYFKDNISPELYSLSDISRMISDTVQFSTKALIQVAGEGQCDKIQTSTAYTIWVCSYEGLRKIVEEVLSDESSDILRTVNEFINNQYRTLPSPVEEIKHNKQMFSKRFFSMVTALEDLTVRYVKIGDIRWFAVQDIIRCARRNISDAEEKFKQVDESSKCDIVFRNNEKRLCVNEDGVRKFFDIIYPDTSKKLLEDLILNCKTVEQMISSNEDSVKEIIVDGDNTDPSRYLISGIKNVEVVMLRYDKHLLFDLYNVNDVATALDIKYEEVKDAAKRQPILFVKDGKIYTTIEGLAEIFKDNSNSCNYLAKLLNEIFERYIRIDGFKNTSTHSDLVYLTREQLEKEKEAVPMKHFRPLKTSGPWYVVSYSNVEVKDGKHVLICFAKKNPEDVQEKLVSLFWTTSVGLYVNCSRFGRYVKELCNEEECCKVTISDLKKFNIKMITAEAMAKVLRSVETIEEPDKVIEELLAATVRFATENKETIDFELEKYNTRRKATVSEETITQEEPKQETVVEQPVKEDRINLQYSQITYEGRPLKIAIHVDLKKGAVIYYDIKQLCDILDVEENRLLSFNRQVDNEGNPSLISIYDISNAFSGLVDNLPDITRRLFNISKPVVIGVAERLGMKIKDDTKEQEDVITKLLNSKDSRSYTLGAIVLAEKFRELILMMKLAEQYISGISGPSDNRLLDTLWKYIDVQEPDQNVPFGFKKQVVIVNERYNRLKKIIEN